MIVHDQFGCISELHGKDPGGLLVGTSIPGPADEIQQLAVTVALINLRVKDLGNLKLQLAVMTRSMPVLTPSLHPLGPGPIPDVSSWTRSASRRIM